MVLAAAGSAEADQEPNDNCSAPDGRSTLAIPFVVTGVLEARGADGGDVDVFTVTGAPDTAIRVSLDVPPGDGEGVADTLLGYFDSDCNLIEVNDDYQGLGATLTFHVPRSGRFLLAVTGGGDRELTGAHPHVGSYELSAQLIDGIGAIGGYYLDAATGQPTGGGWATLYRCTNGSDPADCTAYATSEDASSGAYRFSVDSTAMPLTPGRYRVQGRFLDVETWSAPFQVAAGEDHRVPTLYYEAAPQIGELHGRVVDARTGAGLSGEDYPNVLVRLSAQPCLDYCESAAASPDREGYFVLDAKATARLQAGTHSLSVTASDYEPLELRDIDPGHDGERIALGDLVLEPKPIRLAVTAPCDSATAQGGRCRFTIRVANRSTDTIRGTLWSVGQASTPRWIHVSDFPIGQAARLSLRAGEVRAVSFMLPIPSTLPVGTPLCAQAFFGEGDGAEQAAFPALADTMFCLSKTENRYEVLSKGVSRGVAKEEPRAERIREAR